MASKRKSDVIRSTCNPTYNSHIEYDFDSIEEMRITNLDVSIWNSSASIVRDNFPLCRTVVRIQKLFKNLSDRRGTRAWSDWFILSSLLWLRISFVIVVIVVKMPELFYLIFYQSLFNYYWLYFIRVTKIILLIYLQKKRFVIINILSVSLFFVYTFVHFNYFKKRGHSQFFNYGFLFSLNPFRFFVVRKWSYSFPPQTKAPLLFFDWLEVWLTLTVLHYFGVLADVCLNGFSLLLLPLRWWHQLTSKKSPLSILYAYFIRGSTTQEKKEENFIFLQLCNIMDS